MSSLHSHPYLTPCGPGCPPGGRPGTSSSSSTSRGKRPRSSEGDHGQNSSAKRAKSVEHVGNVEGAVGNDNSHGASGSGVVDAEIPAANRTATSVADASSSNDAGSSSTVVAAPVPCPTPSPKPEYPKVEDTVSAREDLSAAAPSGEVAGSLLSRISPRAPGDVEGSEDNDYDSDDEATLLDMEVDGDSDEEEDDREDVKLDFLPERIPIWNPPGPSPLRKCQTDVSEDAPCAAAADVDVDDDNGPGSTFSKIRPIQREREAWKENYVCHVVELNLQALQYSRHLRRQLYPDVEDLVEKTDVLDNSKAEDQGLPKGSDEGVSDRPDAEEPEGKVEDFFCGSSDGEDPSEDCDDESEDLEQPIIGRGTPAKGCFKPLVHPYSPYRYSLPDCPNVGPVLDRDTFHGPEAWADLVHEERTGSTKMSQTRSSGKSTQGRAAPRDLELNLLLHPAKGEDVAPEERVKVTILCDKRAKHSWDLHRQLLGHLLRARDEVHTTMDLFRSVSQLKD
ncbi:hypothetical protein TRAPUB_5753 [Trametes pubescens]|uniref:Uncharacterized protein n=1 Tax=Trametes pubescens TaxID=154538 RepID=A0A1M2V7R4_TRAPU|nr:hypothetical protein TRAPUB_5753 [Trametes pubescens]